jgi:hypothetical protein
MLTAFEQLYDRWEIRDWVTINGVHVFIGEGGKIEKGPKDLIGKKPSELGSKAEAGEPKLGLDASRSDFNEAVANTKGTKLEGKQLTVDLVRYQKAGQAGEESTRTGVFFLVKDSVKGDYAKGGTSGGSKEFEHTGTYENPLVVQARDGGDGPMRAYDAIKGDGSAEAMNRDVTKSMYGATKDYYPTNENMTSQAQAMLTKYGGDASMASRIVEVDKQPALAVVENIIAHAVRGEGHDAVVSYDRIRGKGLKLTEVFDLKMKNYPGEKKQRSSSFEVLLRSWWGVNS